MPPHAPPPAEASPRQTLPTGVPNLDGLLGGGVPRGALVLVVGPPGSGKTTLASQIVFMAAQAGQRAIVFTALSEPSSKLIEHLASFAFFAPEVVRERIQFLSLEQFLSERLDQASEAILAATRRARAGVVVLDGFRGMRPTTLDQGAARQFLYTVGSALSVTGTTTIITSEADPEDPAFFPETTTADVILGLYLQRRGMRHQRRLEVIKLRGAALVPGLHGLVIGPEGLVVTPRLESRVGLAEHLPQPDPFEPTVWAEARALAATGVTARAAFGLPVLDAALEGGLTRGSSTLVMGHLGTGKTLLGLQFAVAGALVGEPTVFLSFRETYAQLAQKVLPFTLGQQLEHALAPAGPLTLVRWPPVELQADVVADHLLARLDQVGAQRLVVDSIAELERAATESADPARVQNFLAALVESLRRRQVTTLFIREVSQDMELTLDLAEEPVAVLAENVLLLRQIEQHGQLRRALSVAKMRFSAYDGTALQAFRIAAPEGISVLGPLGAEAASAEEPSARQP